MDAGIISSLITGFLALIGVIFSNVLNNNKIQHTLDKSQAVTETKLENMKYELGEVKEEISRYNKFGERIPVIEEQIKVINHRLEDLERGDK